MNSTTAKELLKNSYDEFLVARNELNRPHEDVVSYTVCNAAKHFLNNLLKLYLLNDSINYKEAESLADLMALCIEKEKYFKTFDITHLSCQCEKISNEGNHYCLETEKVKACILLVDTIKDFVFEKMNIIETELK